MTTTSLWSSKRSLRTYCPKNPVQPVRSIALWEFDVSGGIFVDQIRQVERAWTEKVELQEKSSTQFTHDYSVYN
jgi:hypothetical protein